MIAVTPAGVPIGHADHSLTEAHWAFIDEVMREEPQDGFFRLAVRLPDELPSLPSALYGPACDDDPIKDDEVEYVVRGNRPGPSRLIDRPHREGRWVVVIGLGVLSERPMIFTAYGSLNAVISPREWWDASMRPAEAIESAQFWAEHALAK